MWKTQPYDLYHRPFDLYHVVPDPFWDTRKKQDRQADSTNTHHIFQAVSHGDTTFDKITSELQTKVTHLMETRPSIIPKSTLKRGAEKYALGRRFFIIAKGYFGIGPANMRIGDSVASLHGSPVPFVLRRAGLGGGGRSAWNLIGETAILKYQVADGNTQKILAVKTAAPPLGLWDYKDDACEFPTA
ncbi:het protein [Fusarium langsethiae]|uniref:Het protein n=1 Tax=Fusarium langsethiae TaxID=179993 RepID=A0A0M9ES85_FUSLA|nr:het protein [Fusarium langsethiae]GKU12212.1 unnamed protein product [Fusarium langsethiae]GKU14363.1 unnamed protein product [Fusarium langsethiae]